MTAARFLVSGKVQGVFFRASAKQQAMQWGLRGYANNLDDGRVEVFVCGEPEQIGTMAQWLKHGPPMARVDRVERETVAEEPVEGFAIG